MRLIDPAALGTRFAVPAGTAAEVLAALEAHGLGVARARVAARLGNPDPFALRAALAEAPGAEVRAHAGEPMDPDRLEAALVAAGPDPGLAGLFAFHRPGPRVRAVPTDGGVHPWLRWRAEPPPPYVPGPAQRWTTAELGDESIATVRCFCAVRGGLALGSDYGLTLWQRGSFRPFPWPRGARREARRVEAMAATGRLLSIATQQALVTWDFEGEPKVRKHAPDQEEGWDEAAAMHASGDRLLIGWRTHLEGGQGPADVIAFAADPEGVVYAGTRAGELHVVDGGGPVRQFVVGKGRPVRHLAFALGRLWVAAGGELHCFDGASWAREPGEPGALGVDERGRLWAVRDGRVALREGEGWRDVATPVARPWALGFAGGSVWVGGVGEVARLRG